MKALEKNLSGSIFAKSKRGQEKRTLEKKFKDFDKDGSGAIEFKEFCLAMEMYGLSTAKAGGNGIPVAARVQALFDRHRARATAWARSPRTREARARDSTTRPTRSRERPRGRRRRAPRGGPALAMPPLGATPAPRAGRWARAAAAGAASTLMPATPGGPSRRGDRAPPPAPRGRSRRALPLGAAASADVKCEPSAARAG